MGGHMLHTPQCWQCIASILPKTVRLGCAMPPTCCLQQMLGVSRAASARRVVPSCCVGPDACRHSDLL